MLAFVKAEKDMYASHRHQKEKEKDYQFESYLPVSIQQKHLHLPILQKLVTF